MRLFQARNFLPCIALSLFATAVFSQQQLFLSPQTAQQQQGTTSPGCVPVPGGPPCPPTIPSASDFTRGGAPSSGGLPSVTGGGVPTLRSPQSGTHQSA